MAEGNESEKNEKGQRPGIPPARMYPGKTYIRSFDWMEEMANPSLSIERLAKAKPGDVQEVAAAQIQLLVDYYGTVLKQAKKSFNWALIAAGVGLLSFLGAATFLIAQKQAALIASLGGALIEGISTLLFYLYGKTSDRLAEFHSRLEVTQRFLLANNICEQLEGEAKHAARVDLIKTIAAFGPAETLRPREQKGGGKKDSA